MKKNACVMKFIKGINTIEFIKKIINVLTNLFSIVIIPAGLVNKVPKIDIEDKIVGMNKIIVTIAQKPRYSARFFSLVLFCSIKSNSV